MASRRMFSLRIINSARFLKMPISSQCLYFHLGLHADDDGIVEAYTVMNAVGASEDDIRVLTAKGFVTVLNEDLVAYINDWQENNKIRSDRKTDSIYRDLLLQVLPDVQLQDRKPRADSTKKQLIGSTGLPMDDQWTTSGLPMDTIGKDRVGEDRVGQDRAGQGRIDYNGIKDAYNSICTSLPEVKSLSDARKKAIKARLNTYSVEELLEAFRKAESSDFLKGKNKRNWIANFDWILKDSNIAKILDGNYDKEFSQGKTADMLQESYDMMDEWAEQTKGMD